jgi:hypothetical protein
MSLNDANHNPLILPDLVDKRILCKKCGSPEYLGRRVQGVLYRRCRECGELEQGGLPQEPMDPTVPSPPLDPKDRPAVEFLRNSRGEFEEHLNRPNTLQEYRKGAPIPKPGEE